MAQKTAKKMVGYPHHKEAAKRLSKGLAKKKASIRKAVAKRGSLKRAVQVKKKTHCRMPAQNKAKARVQIALDAIAQVRAKRFRISDEGMYVGLGKAIELKDVGRPLETKFSKETTVCALGGLFVTEVSKNNEIKIKRDWVAEKEVREGEVMRTRLRKYFSEEQMELIEGCFENSWYFDGTEISYRSVFPGPATCFIAICENIIRNKGTFKPEQDDPDLKMYDEVQEIPKEQTQFVRDIRDTAHKLSLTLGDVTRVVGVDSVMSLEDGDVILPKGKLRKATARLKKLKEDIALEKKITHRVSFDRY